MSEEPLYKPVDYFSNVNQFGHRGAGGRVAASLKWPSDGSGSARLLRAAVLQHLIVLAAEEARRRRPGRPSLAKIARGGQVDISHLRDAVHGVAFMQMGEVATLASVPEAFPDPEQVHAVLITATAMFAQEIQHSGKGVAGPLGLLSTDAILAEKTIGALQGWVAVRPAPGEREVDEHLATAAHPLLERNALEQADAAGLPLASTHRRDSIVIRAADTHAPAAVSGCYDPLGPILTAHLPRTWVQDVHDRGWTVLDGHFIVEVLATHGDRPETVRAVRLHPETPDDPDTEWLYRADPATVSGPADKPSLTFAETPPRS